MPPSFYKWVLNNNNGTSNSATVPATTRADPIYHHHHQQQQQRQDRQEKARSDWDFHRSSVISTDQSSSDILGAVEFDPSDQLLATGGLSRKIRIYPVTTLLDISGSSCDLFYICTPAKLSSLRWKPNCRSHVIAAGDYDGVVTEYDIEKRMPVFERDEHGGRKVWTVAYSHFSSPQLAASGSDDGTAHLWDPRCQSSNGKFLPGENLSPVCSVEFDPSGGPLIGIGSADKKAYVYDLRMVSSPVSVFKGHKKTVTYVRFVGGGRIVTASTDGTIKMWDSVDTSEVRKYEGHVNKKCFVGLSIWGNGGLIGCGSESNEVYVYDLRWGDPIWVQRFGEGGVDDAGGGDKKFVSGVCWRQQGGDECMLVAGGSDGGLQVSVGRRKRSCF